MREKPMVCLSGAAGRLRDIEFLRARGHGRLMNPDTWKNPKEGIPYGLDNGAFAAWRSNKPFPTKKFLALLAKVPRAEPPFMAVCPDKVAAGMESLKFSRRWRRKLDALGYGGWIPWYLAVQDGMTEQAVAKELQTGRWAGLFVGGTMAWKLKTGEAWVKLAHEHGVKAHIGRTPQVRHLVWADAIGADSCDSTDWARKDRHERIDAARLQSRLVAPQFAVPAMVSV